MVWGPHDFGGRAHVHFWFFGFNISFGADENADAKKAIMLPEFIEMVIKPGPANNAPPDDTIGSTGGTNTNHKYSVEAGIAPQVEPPADKKNNFPSTGATSEWQVLAGTLSIRIDCGFALSQAFMEQLPGTKHKEIFLPNQQSAPAVHSWPMHCNEDQNFNSILNITIRKVVNQEIQDHFKSELVLKSVSKALWSKYNSKVDPLQPNANLDHLKNASDGTDNLVQAVRITPPDPQRALSSIIPFDATAAMKFTIPYQPLVPATQVESSDFQSSYFENLDSTGKRVDGVKRWKDFQDMWQSTASTTTVTESQAIVDVRKAVTDMVADVCEWQIRPPEQMANNNPPTTTNAIIAPHLPTMRSGVANAPQTHDDKRTDWQLMSSQPSKMIGLLDIYYPSLPYVCG